MFNNISWGLFLLYTSGALLVYYFVLIVVQAKGWWMKNKTTSGQPPFVKSATKDPVASRAPARDGARVGRSEDATVVLQSTVHDLVDEIQAFCSAVEKVPKDEMLFRLQQLLAKYPTIKGSIYQEGINNLIAVNCANNCSIRLSAEEVDGLWR